LVGRFLYTESICLVIVNFPDNEIECKAGDITRASDTVAGNQK